MKSAFVAAPLALFVGLVCGMPASAASHTIVVTVVRNGSPAEASVTVVDHGANPPEHAYGITRDGVYRFSVWADEAGTICFKAQSRFAPVYKSEERCVRSPYPRELKLELR